MTHDVAGAAMSALVLLPLLGAIMALVVPRSARLVVIAVAFMAIAGVVVVAAQLSTGPVRHHVGGWGAPLGIELYADGFSVVMLGTTAILCLIVSLHATVYFAATPDRATGAAHFQLILLLLWAGLNALFLSGDVFNLYVTLELVALAAVTLVALDGGRAALRSALKYLFVGIVGAMSYLIGVELLYSKYATLDVSLLAQAARNDRATTIALVLMSGGLLLKAALVPLHFWLPAAHANAPAPSSALLSALVVKASVFVFARVWGAALAPAVFPAAGWALGALGALGIAWGSVQALRAERLKMLVAYSTVAQIGVLFGAMALTVLSSDRERAWAGLIWLAASHAFAKAGMFLAAGTLSGETPSGRLSELRVSATSNLAFIAFGLAGLSLMGLPPTGGFLGKWLLLQAGFASAAWWAIVIGGSGLLTAAYVFRVLRHAFPDHDAYAGAGEERVQFRSRAVDWAPLALSLAAVLLGFAGSWL